MRKHICRLLTLVVCITTCAFTSLGFRTVSINPSETATYGSKLRTVNWAVTSNWVALKRTPDYKKFTCAFEQWEFKLKPVQNFYFKYVYPGWGSTSASVTTNWIELEDFTTYEFESCPGTVDPCVLITISVTPDGSGIDRPTSVAVASGTNNPIPGNGTAVTAVKNKN